MDPELDPFVRPFTLAAKIGIAFFVLGVITDVIGAAAFASASHKSGMNGLGEAYIGILAFPASIVVYLVGGIAASIHKWRGSGERGVAIVCAAALIVGPGLLALVLAAA